MSLIINFYVLCIISIIALAFGIDIIINAYTYTEERIDVIINMIMGISIISITISNFVFYIRRHLTDFNDIERKEKNIKNSKIGEWLQLIILFIFSFSPIWNIPHFIEIKNYKEELYRQISISIIVMITSLFLIYQLNPLNIKNKILKKYVSRKRIK